MPRGAISVSSWVCNAVTLTLPAGTGRLSIYGEKFADEPTGLKARHAGPGVLAMVRCSIHALRSTEQLHVLATKQWIPYTLV
jgi:hypothetical protein